MRREDLSLHPYTSKVSIIVYVNGARKYLLLLFQNITICTIIDLRHVLRYFSYAVKYRAFRNAEVCYLLRPLQYKVEGGRGMFVYV